MADFNGKPLVFRDDVEREFWGRVYASEWGVQNALSRGVVIDAVADNAVIGMRMRQPDKPIFPLSFEVCSVCLRSCEEPHVEGCPKAKLET